MKNILRSIVVFGITLLARAVVKKYKPQIVVVTGSVGKTSAKDAVAGVLALTRYIRKSEKSYNSDTGVPLTVLGCKNPWNNYAGWFRVFREGFALLFFPNHYPEILVLEVGADKPGDIRSLMSWITPSVVVLTRLPEIPVHVEAYPSPDAVREEEFIPARMLLPQGVLVMNADDPFGSELAKTVSETRVSYGIFEEADVSAQDIAFTYNTHGEVQGMSAVVHVAGKKHTIALPGVLGVTHIYPTLAALAVGEIFHVPVRDALSVLSKEVRAPGRMRIIPGIKNTTIIDDTYNASPVATEEALSVLHVLGEKKRKIVVLGDMLELGIYSVAEHERIGALIPKHTDTLITVGIRARAIAEMAQKEGMSEKEIYTFDTSHEAKEKVKELLGDGDIVLVKGSQGMRTERIVEAIMREPLRAKELLARQEKEWKERE